MRSLHLGEESSADGSAQAGVSGSEGGVRIWGAWVPGDGVGQRFVLRWPRVPELRLRSRNGSGASACVGRPRRARIFLATLLPAHWAGARRLALPSRAESPGVVHHRWRRAMTSMAQTRRSRVAQSIQRLALLPGGCGRPTGAGLGPSLALRSLRGSESGSPPPLPRVGAGRTGPGQGRTR